MQTSKNPTSVAVPCRDVAGPIQPGQAPANAAGRRLLVTTAMALILTFLLCPRLALGDTRVSTDRNPVIVKLRVGSFRAAIDSSSPRHKALKASLTGKIESVARGRRGRLITIQIVDLKFQYSELSASKRRLVRQLAGKGEDPRDWYERQVATLHRYLVRKAKSSASGGLSVADLPLEKSPSGKPVSAEVQQHYASLISKLDAFVISTDVGIESGEVDPTALMQAMPQAFAGAGERPIFYRVGSKWEVIEDPTHSSGSVSFPTVDISTTLPLLVDGELSTFIFNDVSPEMWTRLEAMGVKKQAFVTEWAFLAPGGAQMIAGLPKWDRYLLGLEPYDLDKLQVVIADAVEKVRAHPEIWDQCICLNYEDPLPWLWWKKNPDHTEGEQEQDREDAFAMYARVLGRALAVSKLEDDVKVGGWSALICTPTGLEPPPWCVAAGRIGECLHLSGYMKYESAPQWDWLHAQIEAGLEAGFTPDEIRVWVMPYGITDRVQFSSSQLVEMGRIIGEYGVGAVYYDRRLYRDLGVQWGQEPPPAVQKQFDRMVIRSVSPLIRGMNEGAKERAGELRSD